MSIPWDEVREDFPALRRRVYLNSAATGLPPPTVRPAVDRFHRELEEGGDAHWDDWIERREQVRAKVAALIGAEAEEIAFAANTCEEFQDGNVPDLAAVEALLEPPATPACLAIPIGMPNMKPARQPRVVDPLSHGRRPYRWPVVSL